MVVNIMEERSRKVLMSGLKGQKITLRAAIEEIVHELVGGPQQLPQIQCAALFCID